jgi:inner membrane protein
MLSFEAERLMEGQMITKSWLKNSAGVRLLIIALLTLIMLIPASMVESLIFERKSRKQDAVSEVSSKWGGMQTISGPVLTVPYLKYYKNEKSELITVVQYAHFLPADLNIGGELKHEIRYRSIYEIVLYASKLSIEGFFHKPDLNILNIEEKNVLWEDAFIALGITDMIGIKEQISFQWNDHTYSGNPGIKTNEVLSSGVSATVDINANTKKYHYKINIRLNGSDAIYFCPVGENNAVSLEADWGTPSFQGNFLPEKRNITEGAFSANWRALHLNRNYPQQWLGNQHYIENSAFGVQLKLPVDDYQKNMRMAKYALLFISLTFITFFMIELLNRKSMHPVQYILIGFALLIFYTLLLSFSEHMNFGYSYFGATILTIVLIGGYTKGAIKDITITVTVSGILSLLYGYLYVILQLEDFALLMGSAGLFIVLAILMYLTRKIDWYSAFKNEEKAV